MAARIGRLALERAAATPAGNATSARTCSRSPGRPWTASAAERLRVVIGGQPLVWSARLSLPEARLSIAMPWGKSASPGVRYDEAMRAARAR